MKLPEHVTIVEVGPRDGLQNIKQTVPTELKLKLIDLLAESGLSVIEATSFVSPKWVPQMSDHEEVMTRLKRHPGVQYPVLVPNEKGMINALNAGATSVAIFAACSETFSQKNTNCTIAESIERFTPIMKLARENHVSVRGYLSCVVGCPYEGAITPSQVKPVADALLSIGCTEISLGDTIGVATPNKIEALIETLSPAIPVDKLALHCHDTYGQGVVNCYQGLLCGISTFDASIGGLGGCPYAKGATGNVATETVHYLMEGLGISTGINREKLLAAKAVLQQLGVTNGII